MCWIQIVYCWSSEVWLLLIKTSKQGVPGMWALPWTRLYGCSFCWSHRSRDCPLVFFLTELDDLLLCLAMLLSLNNVTKEMETKLDDRLLCNPTFIEHRCSLEAHDNCANCSDRLPTWRAALRCTGDAMPVCSPILVPPWLRKRLPLLCLLCFQVF